MSRRSGSVLALALTASALGCGERATTFPRAPVVLISIDTLRSDRLPAYGYRGVATPAIDALARDSILFERAYTSTPLTLPAHATMLTGVLPHRHGLRDNVGYSLDTTRFPTLAGSLRAAGYATGAAVSAFVLRPGSGIETGFESYDASFEGVPGATLDIVQREGGLTLAAALRWLGAEPGRRGGPFFLFLHLYEPHAPYEPPEPFRALRDPYDGEVAAADAIVGRLLDDLRRDSTYDRALIVLLSDHGEGLGDHGEQQHGIFLYRSTLQVPLLIKLPGSAQAGRRVGEPVQLADVTPTLLAAAGAPSPAGLDGEALLRAADSSPQVGGRALYAETFYPRIHFGWSDLASLVRGEHHYIEAPQPELYDLVQDPGETSNRLADDRRTTAELRDALRAVDRTLAAPAEADPETAAKLAALGYLGTSAAAGRASGPLPDPKTKTAILADLERAMNAAHQGDDRTAVDVFARVLAAEPAMPDIWNFYATSLQRLDRKDEAAAAFEKSLEAAGGAPHLALGVAGKLLELGRPERATEVARLAERLDPAGVAYITARARRARGDRAGAVAAMRAAVAQGVAGAALRRDLAEELLDAGDAGAALGVLAPVAAERDATLQTVRATVLSDLGRQEEASQAVALALEIDPKLARALEIAGVVALRSGRPAEARGHLERALAINPRLPKAWNTLGVALFQTAQTDPALEAWRRATELDPKQHEAWFNLGLVAAAGARRDEARLALRRFLSTAPAGASADRARAQQLLKELG